MTTATVRRPWPCRIKVKSNYITPSSDGIGYMVAKIVPDLYSGGYWVFDRRAKTLVHWRKDNYGIARCLKLYRNIDESYIKAWHDHLHKYN